MSKSLLFFMVLMISISVEAIECEKGGGITVKGNNGTYYCYSKNKMNWWTGLGWCQSIGKKMIHYPEDCRCVGAECPEEMVLCPNLKAIGISYVWTSTPFGEDYAYYIKSAQGGIATDSNRAGTHYVLCY